MATLRHAETEDQAAEYLADIGPASVLTAFASALHSAGALSNINALLSFMEKPWHWAREFHAWENRGMPLGLGDEGWDEFLADIDN